LLQPLRPSKNLTEEVVERIAQEIRAGRFTPGDRLPSEPQLVAAMGVSRTVVREAVAALRANGLVVTRQGLGVFVAAHSNQVTFRITTDAINGQQTIGTALQVMELRLAVETEAAALAAERASKAQRGDIKSALRAMTKAIAAGQSAVPEDFAFHRAIADATNNPHFPVFLAFLGRHVIPRQMLRHSQSSRDGQSAYLAAIQQDHVAISDAICCGNAVAARGAMRVHLTKSIARYQRLDAAMTRGSADKPA
jgi:GntR family transcriptional regulator, transcriptional repressor for pyruvate dehydrogenase complex